MVDGQFKWIFCLKIVLFKKIEAYYHSRSFLLKFAREKAVKNFEEPDNCDPVLLCTSTDMETIWAWCVVLIHQYFLTQTVWKKKEKNI